MKIKYFISSMSGKSSLINALLNYDFICNKSPEDLFKDKVSEIISHCNRIEENIFIDYDYHKRISNIYKDILESFNSISICNEADIKNHIENILKLHNNKKNRHSFSDAIEKAIQKKCNRARD